MRAAHEALPRSEAARMHKAKLSETGEPLQVSGGEEFHCIQMYMYLPLVGIETSKGQKEDGL